MDYSKCTNIDLLSYALGGLHKVAEAEEILNHCDGKFKRLLALPEQQFIQFKGVSKDSHRRLHSIVAIYKLSIEEKLRDGEIFNSPSIIRSFLRNHLVDRNREYLVALYFDNKLKLIEYKYLFKGSVNKSAVHLREIARYALNLAATNLAIAHNHPSGDATPSDEDITMTKELIKVCKILELNLIDHFIVGDTETISLRENKLI